MQDDICMLYTKFHQHHKLFEKVYGKWKVSVNYHLALHLPDVIADYGPPHGYWCFGYERMNGVLADIPNSNRNIEIQILNKIIQQFCFNCYTDPLTPMDETFLSKALIELTSVDRNISTKYIELKHLKELTQIREDMFEYHRAIHCGDVIDWPIQLLHPSKIKVKFDDISIRRSHYFVPLVQRYFQELINLEGAG